MSAKEAQANEELAEQLRQSISDAYGFVEGQERTESFAATTFEDLLDAQIERLQGTGTELRPNVLDRIAKVKAGLVSAVAAIKAQPDSFFQVQKTTQGAVTEETPADPLDTVLESGTVRS